MRARSGIAILDLTLITGGVWLSAETEHFEIHHLPSTGSVAPPARLRPVG